jgi:tetratricopeptide (TPR) repeat protein
MSSLVERVLKLEEYAVNELTLSSDELFKIYGSDGVTEHKNVLMELSMNEIKNMDTTRQRYEYTKLLYYNKKDPLLFFLIGKTFQAERKIDEAKSFYVASINLKHDYIDPYIELSNIYKNNGKSHLSLLLLEHLFRITTFEDSLKVLGYLSEYYKEERGIEKFLLKELFSKISKKNKIKVLYNLSCVVKDKSRITKYINECKELYTDESDAIKKIIDSG